MLQRPARRLNFSVQTDDYDYLATDDLNRENVYVSGGISRAIKSSWTVSMRAQLRRIRYSAETGKDDYSFLEMGVSRRLSQHISLNLRLSRGDRRSGELGREYTENRVNLTFSYDR
jgi:hypothetical protein